MFKLRARVRVLLYFLKEANIREEDFLESPEIKKMNNNGNGER